MVFNPSEMKAKTYPETSADQAYRELQDVLAGQAEQAPPQVRKAHADRAKTSGPHYVQFNDNRYFAHPIGDYGVYDLTQRRVLSLKKDYEVITNRPKRISVKYRDPKT